MPRVDTFMKGEQDEKINVNGLRGRPHDFRHSSRPGDHEARRYEIRQSKGREDVQRSRQNRGKGGDDGKTFVSDKDNKTWKVSNPDALKGHEGHHVRVRAHVDADKDEIHV